MGQRVNLEANAAGLCDRHTSSAKQQERKMRGWWECEVAVLGNNHVL